MKNFFYVIYSLAALAFMLTAIMWAYLVHDMGHATFDIGLVCVALLLRRRL